MIVQVFLTISLNANPPNPLINGHIKKDNIYLPNGCLSKVKGHKMVTDFVTERQKSLSIRIEEKVKNTTGWFSYSEIDREFDLRSAQDRHNRVEIIRRLREKGIFESHKHHNKLLRLIDTIVRVIDLISAGRRITTA